MRAIELKRTGQLYSPSQAAHWAVMAMTWKGMMES